VNARPRFYNPREASPEVLEAMLVGRQPIVDEILADLARQANAATRQHWLIRGPRGIGKTHLIGIVYHRLKQHPLSEAYLPIWLAESEAYSVYSAAVLLLHVAQQLVVELQQSGDDSGEAALRARIAELEQGGDDPALFEELVQLLRDEARSRGKILLVLMENLDAALAGLPGRRGTGQVQRLRSLLSEDKEFLILSTTPTRYLAALLDPRQPLYGQLKERTLQPLTEEEVGQLLTRLAEVTGQPAKAGFEGPEPEFRVRRRVLHRLTGGNPRAVVMAFSVLTGNPGVQAIVEEMSALLDAQTAYFEARLAQLAPRERAVVAAMATAPENLTLKEVAQRSRLPLRALSTQVKRLKEQGYLLPVAGEGGKGALYELGDGLFRLWYQYRKGMQILAPVVEFLALWHPLEELEKSLAELRPTEEESLLQRDLMRLVRLQIDAAVQLARSEAGRRRRDDLWRECAIGIQAHSSIERLMNPTQEYFNELKLQWQGLPGESERATSAGLLGAIALKLEHLGEAETFFKSFLRSNQTAERPSVTEAQAIASVVILLGVTLESQGRTAEAFDIYHDFYPNLANENYPASYRLMLLARILHTLCDKSKEAEPDILEKIELYSTDFLNLAESLGANYESEELTQYEPALQLALFMKGFISISYGDNAERWLAEWARRVSIGNAPAQSIRDILLVFIEFLRLPEWRVVVAHLSKSGDSQIAEQAKLFRLVVNVAAAELDGPRDRARRALARVPPELRQTVSEFAVRIVATQRKIQAMYRTKDRPGKGV
jgi:hypothetical protein